MTHSHDSTTALGTVTGTVFTVAATIDTQDYLKTVILAVIGATVSFAVSLLLKWLWNKINA
jgi:mannitol-specific phosphotransferase system IIBC component